MYIYIYIYIYVYSQLTEYGPPLILLSLGRDVLEPIPVILPGNYCHLIYIHIVPCVCNASVNAIHIYNTRDKFYLFLCYHLATSDVTY